MTACVQADWNEKLSEFIKKKLLPYLHLELVADHHYYAFFHQLIHGDPVAFERLWTVPVLGWILRKLAFVAERAKHRVVA